MSEIIIYLFEKDNIGTWKLETHEYYKDFSHLHPEFPQSSPSTSRKCEPLMVSKATIVHFILYLLICRLFHLKKRLIYIDRSFVEEKIFTQDVGHNEKKVGMLQHIVSIDKNSMHIEQTVEA